MIKICYDIKVYRKILDNIVNRNDVVIELGCHVGKTSKLIAEKVEKGKVICLDNSPEATAKMNNLKLIYPYLKFIKGDVRLHETLKEVVEIINKCNILTIDLGGGYHPDTAFKVYYIWASTFKPNHAIIRNKGLIDFVQTSEAYENIKSKEGWLESCGNQGIPTQIEEFKLWSSAIK